MRTHPVGLVLAALAPVALLVTAASCSAFGDPLLDDLVTKGTITPEQREQIASGSFWRSVIESALNVGLALLGVGIWRGRVNNRRGLPPMRQAPSPPS